MVVADIGLGELLWSLLVLLFMVVYLMLLFAVVADLFRDREMSGLGKAVWAIALLVFPLISLFVYLLTRAGGMSERANAEARAMDAQLQAYAREAGGSSPADQIATAKALLEEGTISADEFEALKRKALA
jgi:hypothetical protein